MLVGREVDAVAVVGDNADVPAVAGTGDVAAGLGVVADFGGSSSAVAAAAAAAGSAVLDFGSRMETDTSDVVLVFFVNRGGLNFTEAWIISLSVSNEAPALDLKICTSM